MREQLKGQFEGLDVATTLEQHSSTDYYSSGDILITETDVLGENEAMNMTTLVKRGYVGKTSRIGVCCQDKKGETRNFRFPFPFSDAFVIESSC